MTKIAMMAEKAVMPRMASDERTPKSGGEKAHADERIEDHLTCGTGVEIILTPQEEIISYTEEAPGR